MSFNGTGQFLPAAAPNFPAVAGTTIISTYYNAVINDICTNGLSNVITRDGQGGPSADISWGSHKITNLAAGTVASDAANLSNLAGYAPLANPIFTGTATVLGAGLGQVALLAGDTTHTGYISFTNPSSIRQGYIGLTTTSGPIAYVNDTGAGHSFSGGPVSATGSFAASSLQIDANAIFTFSSGNPVLVFDGNDFLLYNRTANKLTMFVNSVAVWSVDSSGNMIAKGNITAFGTP
jgi:hypothetical protein